MRLIRLEQIKLYKKIKVTKSDSDTTEEYNELSIYDAIVQYLDDSVSIEMYGTNVSKTYRIETVNNKLEEFLLPKINNKKDNLSDYLIEYKSNKFAIQRVTPKYIDMMWR